MGSLQGHGEGSAPGASLPRLPPGREGGSQRHAGPSAERMSAQVRTRLRFRHLGAAALGAGRRTRKSRSSSPPSPRRAAIPSAPTAVAGEGPPALESGTRATASPKGVTRGISIPLGMLPDTLQQFLPGKTLSQGPVWYQAEASRIQGPGTPKMPFPSPRLWAVPLAGSPTARRL